MQSQSASPVANHESRPASHLGRLPLGRAVAAARRRVRGCDMRAIPVGGMVAGPCSLAPEAMKAWADRNISTRFLIACVFTALVWTCSLAIAMVHIAALAARP
ncbi:MAG: hypothetical protein M9924_16540 [Rhizobiaceae bacterium]|nr:hypothetical protein [Rhizobiaceae bacterium]